VYPKNIVINN